MQFLAATNNLKKQEELLRILAPLGIRVLTAQQAGITLEDVKETGTTFLENALLKARAGCARCGLPCVADDSGLAVDVLDGAPGVYSARYAGEHGNDAKNNAKLLKELQDVPKEQRQAHFACAVYIVFPKDDVFPESDFSPDGRTLFAEGRCEGRIAEVPQGTGGFGYDPLFIPAATETPDASPTMAELDAARKDAISHRGAALRQLAELLRKTIN